MEREVAKESWIESNKMGLGIAISVLIAVGAGVAYWGFNAGKGAAYPGVGELSTTPTSRLNKQPQGIPAPDNTPIEGIASDKPAYVNKIRILKTKVAQEALKGELEMNTIVLIHEALMDITETEFGQSVVNNRKERRVVRGKDDAQYEALVVKGAEEIEQLISKNIAVVLGDCGATTQLYERSCQSWANKNPQFAMMSILMIEKMKTKIPRKTGLNMTLNHAKNMMKFQIEQYP